MSWSDSQGAFVRLIFHLAALPVILREHPWASQVPATSLYTCHGLRTPLVRHNLAKMVASHGLRRRYKPRQPELAIFGAMPALQERALPMAYRLLCLRFTLVVRLIASSRRKEFV